MHRSEVLFHEKGALSDIIDGRESAIRREIEGWDRNKILSVSESDLIAYLIEKYRLNPPQLLRDDVCIEKEDEVKIDVSRQPDYGMRHYSGSHYVTGHLIKVEVPFKGDSDFFRFRPSHYTLSPPHGGINSSKLIFSFSGVKLEAEAVKRDINSDLDKVEKYLSWIKDDCDGWNMRVPEIAERCIRERKQRLLDQRQMVAVLGLPMKRRGDADAVAAVPVVRKKPPVTLPPTPKEDFKPEPTVLEDAYNSILDVIDLLSLQVERSPATFARMEEEQIRDILLVNLNSQYEGVATGETFNAEGKTDILIREDKKNAFIAECKFWNGPKALHEGINQILGYLTWRDTKASLIIFSKNKDFTNVLTVAAEAVPQHPNFKKELKKITETHTRYLFRQKNDPDRDLYLAVQIFNIPQK